MPARRSMSLARSVHLRYREALGESILAIPEGLYPGDYLKPVGAGTGGRTRRAQSCRRARSEWLIDFRTRAVAAMMDMIRDDLATARHQARPVLVRGRAAGLGQADAAEKWLRAHDLVYDGVLEAPKGKTPEDWEPVSNCRCSARPSSATIRIARSRSRTASVDLFRRRSRLSLPEGADADALVDVWGADHAGTVKRIKAAVAALSECGGDRRSPFEVKLVQMVQLMKGGQPFKMSKRSGNFVTLPTWSTWWARTWCASPC
jgi:arginyl-tRNA synthetase